jgi:hypothetical protein
MVTLLSGYSDGTCSDACLADSAEPSGRCSNSYSAGRSSRTAAESPKHEAVMRIKVKMNRLNVDPNRLIRVKKARVC